MPKTMEAILARRFAPFNFSAVPGFPHPVPTMIEWGYFMPIFIERKEDNPAGHLIKFYECMNLLDLQHEDVCMKMFMYSLDGDAREWHFSLPPSSISSLKDFHTLFHEHCKRYFSYEFLFENCCEEYELHDEIEDINRKEIVLHNPHHLSNDLQNDVSSHKLELELDNEEVMILECAENKETFSTAIFKEEFHAHCDIQVIDRNYVKDTFDIVSNVSSSVGYDKLVVEDQLNLDGYLNN